MTNHRVERFMKCLLNTSQTELVESYPNKLFNSFTSSSSTAIVFSYCWISFSEKGLKIQHSISKSKSCQSGDCQDSFLVSSIDFKTFSLKKDKELKFNKSSPS